MRGRDGKQGRGHGERARADPSVSTKAMTMEGSLGWRRSQIQSPVVCASSECPRPKPAVFLLWNMLRIVLLPRRCVPTPAQNVHSALCDPLCVQDKVQCTWWARQQFPRTESAPQSRSG